jgi:hypothetical protein
LAATTNAPKLTEIESALAQGRWRLRFNPELEAAYEAARGGERNRAIAFYLLIYLAVKLLFLARQSSGWDRGFPCLVDAAVGDCSAADADCGLFIDAGNAWLGARGGGLYAADCGNGAGDGAWAAVGIGGERALCTRGGGGHLCPDAVDARALQALCVRVAGAEHEVADGFAGVFAFVEDQLHLLGDGHFDAVLAGEAERGAGGEHAFSHFAAERIQDLRQLRPWPSAWPTVRLRLSEPVQVSTRSPTPERPARVSRRPPQATARRVISAMPRVMSAAAELWPRPTPRRRRRRWR